MFGVNESTVRRRRKKLNARGAERLTVSGTPTALDFDGLVTNNPLDPTTATSKNPKNVGAFAKIFELAGVDPEHYRLVQDSFKFSTWQQTKGNEAPVQLYSYKGTFTRVSPTSIDPKVVAVWRKALQKSTLKAGQNTSKTVKRKNKTPGTYVILVADPQLGKPGTREAVKNWRRGVEKHVEAAKHLGVERLHVAFMGDEVEAVADNYTNQPHTIELNQSQQLELDYDLRVWTLKQALSVGVPLSTSSVISNHGEWTRKGSKDPVTTRSDNASTHIARQVQKLFQELEPYGYAPIEWTIGEKHPGVELTLSGVPCYFSHGYVEKGRGVSVEIKTKNAIERQILGRTDELGTTKLWFMAHYHHLYTQEFEGRTLFGCPALEAERSSEYMLDQYGVWSPPGMLGLVVSDTSPRGWTHQNVW